MSTKAAESVSAFLTGESSPSSVSTDGNIDEAVIAVLQHLRAAERILGDSNAPALAKIGELLAAARALTEREIAR